MNPSEYELMRRVEPEHWWYRGLRSMLTHTLPARVPAAAPRILDAGCGTGANLRLLRQLFPVAHLTGFDRAPEALAAAVGAGADLLRQGDINDGPEFEAPFDLIVACDLLGQRGVAWEAALATFHRLLRPGGILALNVPAFPWLRGSHDAAVHVEHRLLPDELERAVSAAGFGDVDLRFWNCLLLPALLLRRVLSRIRTAPPEQARSDLHPPGPLLNALLTHWILLETRLEVTLALPFGSSIFLTCRRPQSPP